MKHFISKLQLDLEEFANYMIEGEPSLGKEMKQKAKRVQLDAKHALQEAGDCISDFANKLIGRRQKTPAEKFIAQAEHLYSKLENASRSQQAQPVLSAIEGLMQVLSNLMDKIKKAFKLSKEHLLSPSPTVLHRDPSQHKTHTPHAAHKKPTPQEGKQSRKQRKQ